MAKFKIQVLKKYNAFLATLLSLLGFSYGCEKNSVDPVEYGTPHANFVVKGKVTSHENAIAIPNIKVIMHGDSMQYDSDTVYTDGEGNYQVQNDAFPVTKTFFLKFEDVDGVENGSFNQLDTIVEFKDPDFNGGDGDWYSGKTEKELNINLKPKE